MGLGPWAHHRWVHAPKFSIHGPMGSVPMDPSLEAMGPWTQGPMDPSLQDMGPWVQGPMGPWASAFKPWAHGRPSRAQIGREGGRKQTCPSPSGPAPNGPARTVPGPKWARGQMGPKSKWCLGPNAWAPMAMAPDPTNPGPNGPWAQLDSAKWVRPGSAGPDQAGASPLA